MTRPISPLASPMVLALAALTVCGGGSSAVATDPGSSQTSASVPSSNASGNSTQTSSITPATASTPAAFTAPTPTATVSGPSSVNTVTAGNTLAVAAFTAPAAARQALPKRLRLQIPPVPSSCWG